MAAEAVDTRYPSRAELRRIRSWNLVADKDELKFEFGAFMYYVRSLWWNPEWGWTVRKRRVRTVGGRLVRRYEISTGGWSGNEDLIGAMMANNSFWMLAWSSSRRGGHYVFEVPA